MTLVTVRAARDLRMIRFEASPCTGRSLELSEKLPEFVRSDLKDLLHDRLHQRYSTLARLDMEVLTSCVALLLDYGGMVSSY